MFLVKSGGDLAFEIYLPLLGPCLPLLGRLLALQAGDAQWGQHSSREGDRARDVQSGFWESKKVDLKGSFTIFLFSVRSHILNSNGVWYWWFCPEGPKNAQNSRFLGFYFVPRGPWLAAPHGTSTRGAGDLDSQRRGPRLAAPRDLNWRRESRSPGDKIKTQKSWVWGVFRPLRAKSSIPHPITIQNMRYGRK